MISPIGNKEARIIAKSSLIFNVAREQYKRKGLGG